MIRNFIFIIFIFISQYIFALDVNNWDLAQPHINHCESQKDTSMIALNQCLYDEHTKTDAELNKTYNVLINALQDPSFVKNSQRAWLIFRDAQCAYDKSKLGSGSGAPYTWNHCLIDLTEKRILDLKSIYPCNGCMEFKSEYYGKNAKKLYP